MALKYADRVAESTVTVGTGDIMLAGAVDTDHDTFANQFADTDQMPVVVFGGGKWMTFEGRYNSGANSITRMNFRDSSTGSPISLSGTMTVMCGWSAADAAGVITSVAAAAASASAAGVLAAAALAQTQNGADIPDKVKFRSYLPNPGALFGCAMSTAGSSATLTVAAGFAADSTNVKLMRLATSLAKTTAAWVAGAGGGLDTGTIAINTWYHFYVIYNPTTDATDVVFSSTTTPLAGPTALPSGYTLWRRIGSMRTNASSQWIGFTLVEDKFYLAVSTLDFTSSGPTSDTDVTVTLNTPPGIKVQPLIKFSSNANTNSVSMAVRGPEMAAESAPGQDGSTQGGADLGVTSNGSVTRVQGQQMVIMTNTASQIVIRPYFSSGAPSNTFLRTYGWIDTRGRFG